MVVSVLLSDPTIELHIFLSFASVRSYIIISSVLKKTFKALERSHVAPFNPVRSSSAAVVGVNSI